MRRTIHLGPVGGVIFGLLFAVIGYFVAFTFGKPILDNAKASRNWPTVPGEVTRSKVATSHSNGKTRYSFDVVYRYNVKGEEFTSGNVFFGGEAATSQSTAAHDVVRKYREGTQVNVHYEPNNPANAVLEPGARWQSYILYGIGLAFLIVGALAAGSSLFYVLAAGAVIGGVVAGWLGSSSSRKTAQDRFAPNFPSSSFSPPAPPSTSAKDEEKDDGFNFQ